MSETAEPIRCMQKSGEAECAFRLVCRVGCLSYGSLGKTRPADGMIAASRDDRELGTSRLQLCGNATSIVAEVEGTNDKFCAAPYGAAHHPRNIARAAGSLSVPLTPNASQS